MATADEAFELRDAGIESPILVLYPVPPDLAPEAARRQVAVTLGDEALLQRTLAAVAAAPPTSPALQVHLEIETGLGRGGVPVDRVVAAARAIAAGRGVTLAGAWSHLGSPGDAVRTRSQMEAFDAAAGLVRGAGIAVRSWHLVASGGLLAGVSPLYDAVRPGLAIYGVAAGWPGRGTRAGGPRGGAAAGSQPARSPGPGGRSAGRDDDQLRLQLRHIPAEPDRDPARRLCRRLQPGRAATGCRPSSGAGASRSSARSPWTPSWPTSPKYQDPPVTVDDDFVLIGEQGDGTISAAELARAGTTISWEVLAGMARRLPRVYYAAARPVGLRTLIEDLGQWRQSTR